ncbi:hypothetical protein BDFG_03162 [Blastomyces dermatitidis ATCC 26199]|nr:hypothetical protein BDFG_03162 [Blastomyces dermatitidis ATCC 26199]
MSRKQRKANIFFYAALNLAELIELAQRLRNVTCSCDSTQKPFSGSFNWAVVLTFVDGVEWLFRAPRTSYGLESGFTNNGVTTCSDAWKKTRMAWLFMRLVSLDGLQDYHYFTELYLLINKQPAEELFTKFQQQYAKHEVMNMHWILSADDQSPSEIKQSEKVYFVNVGAERHALALKIRLVSMLNRSFVADRQLWHWIEEVVSEQEKESLQEG